ncbi:MAG: hypothetical protein INR71_16440, partial [Terriglobus roseus]|nr:hypothetical protein [Terriglobus roseus]
DAGAGASSVVVSSAANGRYIGPGGALVKDKSKALVLQIADQGNGNGYAIQAAGGYNQYLSIGYGGRLSFQGAKGGWQVFSVTY